MQIFEKNKFKKNLLKESMRKRNDRQAFEAKRLQIIHKFKII